MRLNPEMTLTAGIAAMEKEREALGTAISMLRALIASGVSPGTVVGTSNGVVVPITPGKRPRRGGKKPSIAAASLEILRQAGRPMHGLRELLPALEAMGLKVKHKAGLATILMRTGEVVRTSPGTFAMKGGAANAS